MIRRSNSPCESECPQFKVILVGDVAVGKTSIANYQIHKSFDYLIPQTNGSSHLRTKVMVDNTEVELMIWDTAGQEEFAPLVPLYLQNSSVCIIVASCLNTESCEHIRKWKQIINESIETPKIILAINKIDLLEGDFTSYTQEIIAKYNNDIPKIFFTSAKNGTNIESLFKEIGREALSSQPNGFNTNFTSFSEMPTNASQNKCC
ncbi:small GTP-binding protein [Histomonas meleagridis]|uniref:small GTP-binding protein n=1 Tax=Histomonas meleagridis TaxID=135588 RepID=UPI00355A61BA|nr:small GTP-binding protein [Histomonas meleagridis]KAH0797050.1 small GTP-binding protein [Histomonas meleagridis]